MAPGHAQGGETQTESSDPPDPGAEGPGRPRQLLASRQVLERRDAQPPHTRAHADTHTLHLSTPAGVCKTPAKAGRCGGVLMHGSHDHGGSCHSEDGIPCLLQALMAGE